MSNHVFMTKEQFFQELGISKATFYRRAKKLKIDLSRDLLSPKDQARIKSMLGANLDEYLEQPGYEELDLGDFMGP